MSTLVVGAPFAKRTIGIAICAFLSGGAVRPQEDAVMLTALRSRAAMIRAMDAASRAMGAASEGTVTGNTWRSGLITSHRGVRSASNDIIDVGVSAAVIVTLRGDAPDSVKATFRSQVSATVRITSGERSGMARALLTEMVVRTNQALAADAIN